MFQKLFFEAKKKQNMSYTMKRQKKKLFLKKKKSKIVLD